MREEFSPKRLVRGAPVALAITASWSHREGWHLVVRCRRDLEQWDESHRSEYSFLSTAELADVLDLEVPHVLGL